MPTRKKKQSKKKSSKVVVHSQVPSPDISTRTLKRPDYKSFRLSKRIQHPSQKLPGSFKILKKAIAHIWQHKKLYAIIAGVYLILNLLVVRGFLLTADINEIRGAVSELFGGAEGQIAGAVTVFGILLGSLNPVTEVGQLYQTVLVIVFSMFIIWTLRQTYAGNVPRIKDVFYASSYPLVPFVITLFILGLQLFPVIVASYLYNAAIASGLSTTFIEIFLWMILLFLLVLLSLYMISVTLFSLYIVTLPEMTPIKALRSAKELVQHRRWSVMRKVLFIPFALITISLLVMLPVIFVLGGIAELLFLALSGFLLPFIHSYVYALYRELLA